MNKFVKDSESGLRKGATSHMFRDIEVISAFTEVALVGVTIGKAQKTSIYSKIATSPYRCFACSPLTNL